MGKETAKVLSAIPAFEGREELIVNKQTTNSIIHEVLDAHVHFSTDYDHLVAGYTLKNLSLWRISYFPFSKIICTITRSLRVIKVRDRRPGLLSWGKLRRSGWIVNIIQGISPACWMRSIEQMVSAPIIGFTGLRPMI